MTIDLLEAQAFITDLAYTAGDVTLNFFHGSFKQSFKGGPHDVVTEADKATEEAIVAAILRQYPDHHIVGEEGGGQGAPVEEAEYRWFIDPIDGTANYANRIPHYAISIGLADRFFNPLAGAIFNPITNELVSAVRGQGATLNDRPIQVSNNADMATSIIATGFIQGAGSSQDPNLTHWTNFMEKTRGTRRSGSAALDLAYVAMGRFEAYWQGNLKPWDLMAGVLAVQEAGGKVTNFAGESTSIIFSVGEIVASNGLVHPAMLEVLQPVR